MKTKNYCIPLTFSLSLAMSQMNTLSEGIILLLILDTDDKVIGTLSDGDIRRGLSNGATMETPVSKLMNSTFSYVTEGEDELPLISGLNKTEKKLLPVLTQDGKLSRLIDLRSYSPSLPLSAFIMAGGKGSRLAPLTNEIPKPLLPIGDRPILSHLMTHLQNSGVSDFTISLRYLGGQIEDFITHSENHNASTVYEDEPLGTAGSLALKPSWNHKNVLLLNSDLLTDVDINSMYQQFIDEDLDIIIATVPYRISIPYAVLKTEQSSITSLVEKPSYTYQCNAGIYLFKTDLLSLVPNGEKYDATNLIEDALLKGKKAGYFPIISYWLDIGRPEDYQRAQSDIENLFQ